MFVVSWLHGGVITGAGVRIEGSLMFQQPEEVQAVRIQESLGFFRVDRFMEYKLGTCLRPKESSIPTLLSDFQRRDA